MVSVLQALKDGWTEKEIEDAIRRGYLKAGRPPAKSIDEITHVRRYYTTENPLPLQIEREIEQALEIAKNQKQKFSRRKSARGQHLILSLDVPEDRLDSVFKAFNDAAGMKSGPGNKPNLQLLDALMALFLAYESEGVPLPRTHINQAHIADGRILDILSRYRIGSGSKSAQRYCTLVCDKILPAVKAALA